jgi:hypothetical protein
MSAPGKSLPVYELGPWIGQADPYKLGYVVRAVVTVKKASAPVFPWTLAANANFTATLTLGRAKLESAPLALPAAAYADAAAVAAALQAVFAGSGFTFLSTVTVASDALGRLICVPPTGSALQIVPTLPADELALGFTVQQSLVVTPGALEAQNACNLVAPVTFTATRDVRVIWVPEDYSAVIAAPPLLQADFGGTFYWGYNLQHAGHLWTTAYTTAQTLLAGDILAQWPQFLGFSSNPLVVAFDPPTQLFQARADSWSSQNTNGAAKSVGALYPVFEETFVYSMDEASDALYGNWNEFTPAASIGTPAYATLDFSTAVLTADTLTSVLQQDTSSLSTGWSPVTSLIVTSNDISVLGESISAPAVYGNVPFAGSVASSFASIVAEVSFLGSPCTVWSQENEYSPYVLRRVGMNGDNPLTVISFALNWRDRFGIVRPVMLPAAGGTFSIKAQFLKNGTFE